VAGDPKHGDFPFNRDLKAKVGLTRLFLHSTRLEFPHPEGKQRMVIAAPLPGELAEVLKRADVVIPASVQVAEARAGAHAAKGPRGPANKQTEPEEDDADESEA
jgi:hypothetical protein